MFFFSPLEVAKSVYGAQIMPKSVVTLGGGEAFRGLKKKKKIFGRSLKFHFNFFFFP